MTALPRLDRVRTLDPPRAAAAAAPRRGARCCSAPEARPSAPRSSSPSLEFVLSVGPLVGARLPTQGTFQLAVEHRRGFRAGASATGSGSTGSRSSWCCSPPLLMPLSVLGSWNYITKRERGFYALHADAAHRHGRRVHRARPVPLLRLLGGHAHPDVLHHRDLGRRQPALRRDQVLRLHHGRLAAHAGGHPRAGLEGPGGHRVPLLLVRPPAARTPGASARPRPGSSPPSRSPSPSRCRSSRSTPGCPTRTSRRPPRAACCWPVCC